MRIDDNRLNESLVTMAAIGATAGGGVTRLALSDEDRTARDLLRQWFEDAGLSVRVDDFGTMIGRREGTRDLPPILLGSHLDTVDTGGRFDGVLGVLGALEVVRTLNDHHVSTLHPIEIINWTNEEGSRFQPALLGSGAVTGRFDKPYVYNRVDGNGVRFEDELRRVGYLGSEADRPRDGAAYLELHIEQGPHLESDGLAVGVVDGIIGDTWISVDIHGKADHAGPTPMNGRQDALVAAAELILGVNRIAKAEGDPAVGTVGRLAIRPNVINTVPGSVTMSIDLRSPSGERMTQMFERVQTLARNVSEENGVQISMDRYWTMEPTPFAPEIVGAVASACQELGQEVHHLWSGAGHDAKYAVDLWPSGMIFVRSQGGVSHSEAEYTTPEDIAIAVNVLLLSTLQLTM
jgi:N-carbamoyl-L-amino-acid hydrolase